MKSIFRGLLLVSKWITIAINLAFVFIISAITLPIAWMINYDALALNVKKYAINLMVIPSFVIMLLAYKSNFETFAMVLMIVITTLAMVNAMSFKEIK